MISKTKLSIPLFPFQKNRLLFFIYKKESAIVFIALFYLIVKPEIWDAIL